MIDKVLAEKEEVSLNWYELIISSGDGPRIRFGEVYSYLREKICIDKVIMGERGEEVWIESIPEWFVLRGEYFLMNKGVLTRVYVTESERSFRMKMEDLWNLTNGRLETSEYNGRLSIRIERNDVRRLKIGKGGENPSRVITGTIEYLDSEIERIRERCCVSALKPA